MIGGLTKTSWKPGAMPALTHGARSPQVLSIIARLAETEIRGAYVSPRAHDELIVEAARALAQLRLVDARYRSLPNGVVDTHGRPRLGGARYTALIVRAARALAQLEPAVARPLLAELHVRLDYHLTAMDELEPTDPRGRAKRFTPQADAFADAHLVVLAAIRRLDAGEVTRSSAVVHVDRVAAARELVEMYPAPVAAQETR